jgi:hypothetical protein
MYKLIRKHSNIKPKRGNTTHTKLGYDVAAIEQDLVPGRPPVSPPRVGADVESGWARTGKDGGAGVQMQQLGANKAE